MILSPYNCRLGARVRDLSFKPVDSERPLDETPSVDPLQNEKVESDIGDY